MSSAVIEDGLLCTITEKSWRLSADSPEAMGGDNMAPSPSVLFRASVSSCVAMGVKMWAARLETLIERVEARFETDVDARGQFGVCDETRAGFEGACLEIHIVSNAPAEAVRKVVRTSLRYSAVLDALSSDIPIRTEVFITPSVHVMKRALP
ncbi:MAG: OsmC family protein [Pseudomonadota bacterium]